MRPAHILILLALAAPAIAQQYLSGNAMLRNCEFALSGRAAQNAHEAGLCQGFTTGVIQGIYLGEIASGKTKKGILCPPADVEVGQMIRVAVKYMKDNPSRLHEPAQVLFGHAYRDAFPCPS